MSINHFQEGKKEDDRLSAKFYWFKIAGIRHKNLTKIHIVKIQQHKPNSGLNIYKSAVFSPAIASIITRLYIRVANIKLSFL